MAEIAPFQAVRYDFAALGGDVSDRLAPPYDVLNQDDKDRLLARSDRNIVAIDLPHVPPKSLGPAERYQRAADTFNAWRRDGTLIRESTPAVYIYHQVFEHAGRSYTRRMFTARLRLEEFTVGNVLPHEETFGGPKEDRLALMKATAANLSAVFAVYRDPQDEVGTLLCEASQREPDAVGTIDEVENKVWILKDNSVIDRVVRAVAKENVYIADGHHRYLTAMNYRNSITEPRPSGSGFPELAAGHPANYVMVVLGSMDDPGSLILPTHRVLLETGDLSLDGLVRGWSDGVATTAKGDQDMTLFHGASGEERHVRFTNRAALAKIARDKSAAWCGLDVAYLHRYLIDELWKRCGRGDLPPKIGYAKAEQDARRIAARESGFALLCKVTTMEQLRAVSEAGDLMPQKSTYFYPKVATGLTINPLE